MAVIPAKVKPHREVEAQPAPKTEEREPFMVLVKDKKTGEKTLRVPTPDEKADMLEEEIGKLDEKVFVGKMVTWGTGIGAAISFAAGFVNPGFFVLSALLLFGSAANYFTVKANESDLRKAEEKLTEAITAKLSEAAARKTATA